MNGPVPWTWKGRLVRAFLSLAGPLRRGSSRLCAGAGRVPGRAALLGKPRLWATAATPLCTTEQSGAGKEAVSFQDPSTVCLCTLVAEPPAQRDGWSGASLCTRIARGALDFICVFCLQNTSSKSCGYENSNSCFLAASILFTMFSCQNILVRTRWKSHLGL